VAPFVGLPLCVLLFGLSGYPSSDAVCSGIPLSPSSAHNSAHLLFNGARLSGALLGSVNTVGTQARDPTT